MTKAERFEELLRGQCASFVNISSDASRVLMAHYELLCAWNKKLNLTSVVALEEAVIRHYAESIFLASLLPGTVRKVADLGSGGGFPGFPLAVVHPEVEVLLVESDQRKAAFLREVSDAADNVLVRCVRAESLEGPFDGVVGRAVRPEIILAVARRIAGWFGILVSRNDGEKLAKGTESEVRPLPWDPSAAALVGYVPRETP